MGRPVNEDEEYVMRVLREHGYNVRRAYPCEDYGGKTDLVVELGGNRLEFRFPDNPKAEGRGNVLGGAESLLLQRTNSLGFSILIKRLSGSLRMV